MPPRPHLHLPSLPLCRAEKSLIKSPQWLQSHSFTTTSPRAYPAPAKKNKSVSGAPKKGERVLRIKKKGVQATTAKPPAVGERKALRKRIILSNTNALEVPGLEEMSTGGLVNDGSIGRVMALPGEVVDGLRAVEAFKVGQGWGFFRRPACLVRKETVHLARLIDRDGNGGKTTRKIICGEKGVGKSVLLLEAMAMAFMKGWVVVNLPEGRDLTVGHTAYTPIPNSSPVQYAQPAYTADLLTQILNANKRILSNLKLTSKPDLPFPVAQGTTLAQLCTLGAQEPDRAWPIFQTLWKELQAPGRPPILFCVDNVSHIMSETKYTYLTEEEKLKPIHAHDFVLIKHFTDHLSGEKDFANGGMVLAATSLSEHIKSAALDVSIAALEARQIQAAKTEGEKEDVKVSDFYDPYKKLDIRALRALTRDFSNTVATKTADTETAAQSEKKQEPLEVIRLQGITKPEAKAILEYWATSGMVRREIGEDFVAEKWTVSGGGVLKEMERGVLRRAV